MRVKGIIHELIPSFCNVLPRKKLGLSMAFLLIVGFIWMIQVFISQEKYLENGINIDDRRLYAHVQYLSSIVPARNSYHMESLNKAADYIHQEFKVYSKNVTVQRYTIADQQYKNIIASFGMKNTKRMVIGAHYDVCDEQPGADDNASGIAGLLEIARWLKTYNKRLKCRVDLVAYTLEEPPYFKTRFMGSAIHARSLSGENARVDLMIALEMIGYYSDRPNSQRYPMEQMKWIYPKKGDYIAIVGRTNEIIPIWKLTRSIEKNTKLKAVMLASPTVIPGIDNSDHLNFWKEKYSAMMVTDTSFYRNGNYHNETDTVETLDFNRMAKVVAGVCCFIRDF